MKRYLYLSALMVFAAGGWAHAALWMTDYKAALAQAKSENKQVLLNFTQSDASSLCKKLDADVFSKPVFTDYADTNLILVTLDFPHTPLLSSALKDQNEDLRDRFKVRGYPTLVVVDATGKELGRHQGYRSGTGAKAIVEELQTFVKNPVPPAR